MVSEQANAQNMYQNLQDQSMQMSQTENDSASAMHQTAQENLVNESQNRIMAIAEHIQHPVSTRYDDIYHPRTDKRVIRKFFFFRLANCLSKIISVKTRFAETFKQLYF